MIKIEDPQLSKKTLDKIKQYPEKIIYHSEKSPGIWVNQKDNHIPVIERDSFYKNKIKVTIPFKGTKKPRHYIEVILLKQGKKEIKVKKISFSYHQATATFILPNPKAKDYSIVAKCNIHGMWEAMVPILKEEN